MKGGKGRLGCGPCSQASEGMGQVPGEGIKEGSRGWEGDQGDGTR